MGVKPPRSGVSKERQGQRGAIVLNFFLWAVVPKWVLFDNNLRQQSAASPLHKLEGRMKMKEKRRKERLLKKKQVSLLRAVLC